MRSLVLNERRSFVGHYDHAGFMRASAIKSFCAAVNMPRRICLAEDAAQRRLAASEIQELEGVILSTLAGELEEKAMNLGATALQVEQVADSVFALFRSSQEGRAM